MENSVWGAIFDFDGVVVNTGAHHYKCWQQVAEKRDRVISREQFLLGFGVKNSKFISDILKWTQDPKEIEEISKQKEALFQEIAQTVPLVSGLEAFLKDLKQANISCAIASSSILKNIQILLDRLPIKHYFSHIVSGEDVREGKPNPEVFVQAANRLKIVPAKCVVFEDALYGIEAADRAGCKKVAVTTAFASGRFEALGIPLDKIIHSFEEISVLEIDSWFA